MIQAEVSIYPMGTSTTSASFHIAKAIETIQNIDGIKYEINSMGTIIESDSLDKIFQATQEMSEAVHNLGVGRVEVILKIDSRRDKEQTMQEKLDSVKSQLKS